MISMFKNESFMKKNIDLTQMNSEEIFEYFINSVIPPIVFLRAGRPVLNRFLKKF